MQNSPTAPTIAYFFALSLDLLIAEIKFIFFLFCLSFLFQKSNFFFLIW